LLPGWCLETRAGAILERNTVALELEAPAEHSEWHEEGDRDHSSENFRSPCSLVQHKEQGLPPYLVPFKILKLYKILRYVESLNTYMKY